MERIPTLTEADHNLLHLQRIFFIFVLGHLDEKNLELNAKLISLSSLSSKDFTNQHFPVIYPNPAYVFYDIHKCGLEWRAIIQYLTH